MKKLYFFIITCLMISEVVMAQTATPPSVGDGSSGSPYEIATLNNLYWLSKNSAQWGKYFIQTANIDASTTASWDDGNGGNPDGAVPIGNSSSNYFQGSYDGQDYTIDGLYIYRGQDNQGLFGWVGGSATISNLGLTNVEVHGNSCVGGLAGRMQNTSSVTNCYVTGSVFGAYEVGGLIGWTQNTVSVTNCYVTGSATDKVDGYWVGGLIGQVSYYGYVENCFTDIQVNGTMPIANNLYAGGLVGYNEGWNTANDNRIYNCYAMGNVTATGYNVHIGGLIGISHNATISNCYAKGLVTVGGGSTITGIGGLFGVYWSQVINNNCYWDSETTGIAGGLSTADMKTVGTYIANWDFSLATGPWAINGTDNDGVVSHKVCKSKKLF